VTRRRRQGAPAPNLTSLLDVLFILVFASLVHAASRAGGDDEAAAPPDDAPPAPEAPPPPPPPPELAALRDHALAELRADLAGRPSVVVRIAADGVVTALELADRRIPVGVPLLEPVADADVELVYRGDRTAALRVCSIAALRLAVADLDDFLIVITTERTRLQLPVALNDGLRRDAERCLVDQRGIAVVIDPAALGTPSIPDQPPP
jgi:hypothetical protein